MAGVNLAKQLRALDVGGADPSGGSEELSSKLKLFGGGGGGNTMTINITMPPGTDGAGVVEAIRRYERMNGTGWRN